MTTHRPTRHEIAALRAEADLPFAKLSGAVQRLFHQQVPTDEAVAELQTITTLPDILGYAAGHFLADARWPERGQGCAELLFAAGGSTRRRRSGHAPSWWPGCSVSTSANPCGPGQGNNRAADVHSHRNPHHEVRRRGGRSRTRASHLTRRRA